MVIHQGDIFWIERPGTSGSELAKPRPYVVVQNNMTNESQISTILVCGITSNLKYARARGNVRLRMGEGGLPKESVVNVSQLFNADRGRFIHKLGSLEPDVVRKIVRGITELIEPREPPATEP